MKKVFCFVLAILICASLAFPVLAAEGFVPSITYKGSPDLVAGSDAADADIPNCLEVVPVSEADKLDDEGEALLKKLYKELSDGTMTLPYDKIEGINADKMVIRELLNLAFSCGHDHGKVTLTLDLGVAADDVVVVMVYNDEWVPAENVTNNGDGTVTFTIENLGPVAISVEV